MRWLVTRHPHSGSREGSVLMLRFFFFCIHDFIFNVHMNMYLCVSCVHMSSGAHRPEVSDALGKLELQADVTCSTWVLEPELWSSARATHTLNWWGISPSCFLFSIHSGSWAHCVVLPTVKVGLLTSVNPLKNLLYTHVQRFVSWVILDPVALATNVNHHQLHPSSTLYSKWSLLATFSQFLSP